MIDRYNFSHGDEYTYKNSDGEWVRYEDLIQMVDDDIRTLVLALVLSAGDINKAINADKPEFMPSSKRLEFAYNFICHALKTDLAKSILNESGWGVKKEDAEVEPVNPYKERAIDYYLSMIVKIKEGNPELLTFCHVETPAGTKEIRAGRAVEYTTDISVSEIHFKPERKDNHEG